jgi:hypothetical protein
VVRRLPYRHTKYERMAHFKFPQRILLSASSCSVLLLMMQYVMAAQYDRLAAMLDLSRPLALGEVAAVARYALDAALSRALAAEGVLPPPAGDGLPADMRPRSARCDSTQSVVRPLAIIRDIDADPASRLSFVCLLRSFDQHLIQRTNASLRTLSESAVQAAYWAAAAPAPPAEASAQQQAAALGGAARTAVGLAVFLALGLTVAAVVGLMRAYRADALAAREGRCRLLRGRPARPLGAAMLVGAQTVALGVGWLVFFLGSFALAFSMLWRPLRRYVLDAAGLPNAIVLAALLVVLFPAALLRALRLVRPAGGDWETRLRRAAGLFTAPLVHLRGQWAWFELVGTLTHLAMGFAAAVARGTASFTWQFFRVPRLDVPTRARGFDPGHSAYVSMVAADRVINSPLAATLAAALHRELRQRHRLRATPVSVLAAEIAASDGAVDVVEIERDRRALAARRGDRLRTAMWQLALVEAANDARGLRRTRKALPGPAPAPPTRLHAHVPLRGDGRGECLAADADAAAAEAEAEMAAAAAAAALSRAAAAETPVKQAPSLRPPAGNATGDGGPAGGPGGDGAEEAGTAEERADPRYALGRVRYGRRVPDAHW